MFVSVFLCVRLRVRMRYRKVYRCFADKPEEEQDAFVDKIRSLSQPTNWTLLYDSNAHGLSMNRFQVCDLCMSRLVYVMVCMCLDCGCYVVLCVC